MINIALLLTICVGCAQFGPFEDRRREAGAPTPKLLYVGKSKPESPAICYNSLYTSYAKVKKLADEVCRREKNGTHAVPVKQTLFTCRLLVPNHFYFKCEK